MDIVKRSISEEIFICNKNNAIYMHSRTIYSCSSYLFRIFTLSTGTISRDRRSHSFECIALLNFFVAIYNLSALHTTIKLITMMKCVKPRLITFDVTGTLLMTKLEEHYTEIGCRHGLSIEPRKLARSFEKNFRRLTLEHPVFGKHTGLGWENWWRTIVHNVFKDQNKHIPDTTLNKVADALIECYGTRRCWHTYPGTVELLECLRKYKIILGVISNFDERLEPILVDLKIRPFFSFVLTSYSFGKEKPDTSIFGEALRLSNKHREIDIAPQQAIHVGDTVDNDYLGAKNAQWNALLINHGKKSMDETKVCRDDVFQNLQDLQRHFEVLLNERKKQRNNISYIKINKNDF